MSINKYYNKNCVKHIKEIIKIKCKPDEKVIDVKKLFKLFEEYFNGFEEYVMDYYKTIKTSKLNPHNYEKIWKILLEHLNPLIILDLQQNEKIRVISNHTLQTTLMDICKDFVHYNCLASSIDIDYKIGLSLMCNLNNANELSTELSDELSTELSNELSSEIASEWHRDKCNHNNIEAKRNILIELNKYLDEFITMKDIDERLKKNLIARLSKLENSTAFENDTIKNICIKFQTIAYDIFNIEFDIVASNFIIDERDHHHEDVNREDVNAENDYEDTDDGETDDGENNDDFPFIIFNANI